MNADLARRIKEAAITGLRRIGLMEKHRFYQYRQPVGYNRDRLKRRPKARRFRRTSLARLFGTGRQDVNP